MKLLIAMRAAVVLATPAFAVTASAQPRIVLKDIPGAEKVSPEKFRSVLGEIADGKVLVNDGARFRLSLLDAELTLINALFDSASTAMNKYGTRPYPLIPYLADSSLFLESESRTLVVIDPNGRIARSAAAPSATVTGHLLGTTAYPVVDRNGNLVLRMTTSTRPRNVVADSASAFTTVENIWPDSAPIIRADFNTRKVDTVAQVKQPTGVRNRITRSAEQGVVRLHATVTPLEGQDTWAMLANGTLAVVRGYDYHVDLLRPDGTWTSGEKLPFDWKRLTDSEKQRLVDSTQQVIDKQVHEAELEGGPNAGKAKRPRIAQTMLSVFYNIPLPNDGRLVYDVVSNEGRFITRVRVPAQ